MLNPDGVVVGNYRNGLSGVDLNRQFQEDDLSLLPEVRALKGLLENNKSKLLAYFDFHGHQMRRHIFAYGPALTPANSAEVKLLPQILQQRLDCFRLRSCEFGIPKSKLGTARAFANQFVETLCYTIEASFCGYIKFKQHRFTARDWIASGAVIAESLGVYLQMKQQKLTRSCHLPKQNVELAEVLHESDGEKFEDSDCELYEDYSPQELQRLQHQIRETIGLAKPEPLLSQQALKLKTINNQEPKQKSLLLLKREQRSLQPYTRLNVLNCSLSQEPGIKSSINTSRGRKQRLLQSYKLGEKRRKGSEPLSPEMHRVTIYNFPLIFSLESKHQIRNKRSCPPKKMLTLN